MEEYIGLDVSMKETAVSIRREGKRIWRGKCPSDPTIIAELIRKRAPAAKRVVFETGPLSVWSMNFSMMIGLAVGIDYSLFIVSRYREEREDGKDALTTVVGTLVAVEPGLQRTHAGGEGERGCRPERERTGENY